MSGYGRSEPWYLNRGGRPGCAVGQATTVRPVGFKMHGTATAVCSCGETTFLTVPSLYAHDDDQEARDSPFPHSVRPAPTGPHSHGNRDAGLVTLRRFGAVALLTQSPEDEQHGESTAKGRDAPIENMELRGACCRAGT